MITKSKKRVWSLLVLPVEGTWHDLRLQGRFQLEYLVDQVINEGHQKSIGNDKLKCLIIRQLHLKHDVCDHNRNHQSLCEHRHTEVLKIMLLEETCQAVHNSNDQGVYDLTDYISQHASPIF
jgi:hypothetical protein